MGEPKEKITPSGTRQLIDGQMRVFQDGYWVKVYETPADTLFAKKHLIEALTRRLFNHVEHGLNIPGVRLNEARRAFENETYPEYRRVKGAMLAGALFNRATEILAKLVELQAAGVAIDSDNPLMRECGRHLQEALDLGRMVLHRSGEEGIDELWGEPFKAFAFPIEAFYESRYVKIAQAMRAIDRIADALASTVGALRPFSGVVPLVQDFATAARRKSETLRTDSDIFDVWPDFVVAGERLCSFEPKRGSEPGAAGRSLVDEGLSLLRGGKDLVLHITRARVPMPKSTQAFVDRCSIYHADAIRIFEATGRRMTG